jgi:hypothetical protein
MLNRFGSTKHKRYTTGRKLVHSGPLDSLPRGIQRYDDRAHGEVVVRGDNNGQIHINAMNASKEDCQKEYMEEMEKVGKVSSIEGEQLVVRSYVNTALWKKKKFVAPSRELDYNDRLCQ